MARPAPEHLKAMKIHREKLASLVESRNVNQLQKMYDTAQSQLVRKIARFPSQSFTSHHARQMLAQVTEGQTLIADKLGTELGSLVRETQVESLRSLGKWIGKLEKVYTGTTPVLPIEEAATFWGVVDQRTPSLMRAAKTTMGKLGGRIVGRIENEIGLGMLQGETVGQVADRVQAAADNEWWQAERIARTESSYAYNATAADGIQETNKQLGDLYQRWEEHVSDRFKPLDDRVAIDSIAMHGQVTLTGWFTMPPTTPMGAPVPIDLVGQAWKFPPNRPNDRAAVSAWRPHWGGVAWLWQGGRRVFLSR